MYYPPIASAVGGVAAGAIGAGIGLVLGGAFGALRLANTGDVIWFESSF